MVLADAVSRHQRHPSRLINTPKITSATISTI
jgi:hypothetical protein